MVLETASWTLWSPSNDGTHPNSSTTTFGPKEDLERPFGRGVDLVMERAVSRNPYFAQSVAETRVPLYAA